ncbi:lipoprotein [Listeria floridensis FSL S10-1187]|uniref:Lipoprotein n=1 Tax=Listeria floridensis FSL S10-1187 TaxID=1265817 RepID=A0ABP3AXA1_9LIST|nr:lipoprotein [Listeria floridensis FSL S10-1187]
MKKKLIVVAASLLLILSGCAPKLSSDENVVQKDEEKKSETGIMTKNQISSNYYKTVLPYKASKSRGLVVSNIYSRYDINQLESGLMRLSQKEYSSDDYLFQEGQYLDKELLTSWLARKSSKNKEGLNPEDNGFGENRNPIYLAHILEQDYLKKNDKNSVSLGGISIALAMNSVDYYQKIQYGDTFEQDISDSDLLRKGEEMAQTILERVRKTKGLENVPVMISIYKQGQRDAVAPGNYMAYATANGDTLSNFKTVKEKKLCAPFYGSK